jgi:hypothetical protein
LIALLKESEDGEQIFRMSQGNVCACVCVFMPLLTLTVGITDVTCQTANKALFVFLTCLWNPNFQCHVH